MDQLRQQLLRKNPFKMKGAGAMDVNDSEMHVLTGGQRLPIPETMEGLQCELPFEFQVSEITSKAVCSFLYESMAEFEKERSMWQV